MKTLNAPWRARIPRVPRYLDHPVKATARSSYDTHVTRCSKPGNPGWVRPLLSAGPGRAECVQRGGFLEVGVRGVQGDRGGRRRELLGL